MDSTSCLAPVLSAWRYEWTRPYIVDHSTFVATFWSDATPLADGIRATVAWYRARGAGMVR